MAFRIFTSMLRMSVNILPLFTSISENNCYLLLLRLETDENTSDEQRATLRAIHVYQI